MHLNKVSNELDDWLPVAAEHWSPDKIREFVTEANISDSYLDQLLDNLDYAEDDLPNDDFWFALQNMVYGPSSNTSGNSTYGCDNPKYRLIDWVEWSLVPSFLIIGMFAFIQPRKRLWPTCLNQRPSVAFPVNLIDAYGESWMFACGFAIMATSILDLFIGNFNYNPDISEWPSMLQGTVWMCVVVLNAVQVSMAYYPILLCLTNIKPHPMLSNCTGLVYTLVWTMYYVYRLYECPVADSLEGKVNTAMLVPIYISCLLLNGRFICGIYSALRDYLYKDCEEVVRNRPEVINEQFKKTHYYQRVRFLLTPTNVEPDEKKRFSVRLREKIYPYYTGFTYSRRMVCTSVLVTLILYQSGLFYLYEVGTALFELIHILRTDGYLYEIFEIANATETFFELQFVAKVLDDTFWPTSYTALGIMMCFNLHMHWCYRCHTMQLWRGERSFCPRETFAFSTKVVASLRFSGYHIGFSIWGALLLQVTLWFLIFFIIAVIIAPWTEGQSNVVIELISDYWLATLLGLSLYYGQVLFARVFFLQGKGDVLGIDNRRIFHVTVYVTLFLNAILGLASCLMRILKSLLFGMLFIGRVDRCTLMRGFELWDPGFKAYIGFMELEVAHTHPVMVTFCHLLWEAIRKREENDFENNAVDSVAMPFSSLEEDYKHGMVLRKRRARTRWFVALTLMRNRQLAFERQPLLPELVAIRAESRLERASDKLVNDEVEDIKGALVGAASGLVGFVWGSRSETRTPVTDNASVDEKLEENEQDSTDVVQNHITSS